MNANSVMCLIIAFDLGIAAAILLNSGSLVPGAITLAAANGTGLLAWLLQ